MYDVSAWTQSLAYHWHWGGGGILSPSHGREIFENSCIAMAILANLNVIFRGKLWVVAYQFPNPLFFNLFYSPMNGGGA